MYGSPCSPAISPLTASALAMPFGKPLCRSAELLLNSPQKHSTNPANGTVPAADSSQASRRHMRGILVRLGSTCCLSRPFPVKQTWNFPETFTS